MWHIVMFLLLLLWRKLLLQLWEMIVGGRSRRTNFLLLSSLLHSHFLLLHQRHCAVKSAACTTFYAILFLHRVGYELTEERLLWRVRRFLAWTLFFSCNDFFSWTFDYLETCWAPLALLCLRYFARWTNCCCSNSLTASRRLFSDKRFVLKVDSILILLCWNSSNWLLKLLGLKKRSL